MNEGKDRPQPYFITVHPKDYDTAKKFFSVKNTPWSAIKFFARVVFWWLLVAFCAVLIAMRVFGVTPPTGRAYNRVVGIGTQEITSYNAVPAQCDGDPDHGAYGRVAVNGVPTGKWFASNILAKGTKIIIPSLTGNTVWTCKDRLNPKVWWRIDLLYPLGQSIGLRKAPVYVVK